MTFFDNKISLRTAYFARRRRAKYTLYAQSVFCDIHAAAKNEFHFFRGLRAANSARHLFDRVTKTFAKNPDLRNFTLDNSRICTYNKKADCNDACVAQLVEQLTRNEQVTGSSPVNGSMNSQRPASQRAFSYLRLVAAYSAGVSLPALFIRRCNRGRWCRRRACGNFGQGSRRNRRSYPKRGNRNFPRQHRHGHSARRLRPPRAFPQWCPRC